MSDFLKYIKEFCSEYSMDIILFIAGALGAMVADSNNDVNLTRNQRIVSMFLGGITAVFLTSLFVEVFESITSVELSNAAYSGVGFYLGHIGLQGINRCIVMYSKIKKKD